MTLTESVTGAPSVQGIDVRRVAGSLGAEISGVQAGPDLPGPVVKLIRDALLEHKVIFFRGQDHLDDAGQAGFARLFGELSPHRRKDLEDGPDSKYMHNLDSAKTRAVVWHTDASLTVRPTAITMLRAKVLPPYGGDTAFANTATAYQRMSPNGGSSPTGSGSCTPTTRPGGASCAPRRPHVPRRDRRGRPRSRWETTS